MAKGSGSHTGIANGFLAFLSGEYEVAENFFRDAYRSGIEEKTAIHNLVFSLLKQEKETEALTLVNSALERKQKKNVDRMKMEWLFLLKFLVLIRVGDIDEAFRFLHARLSSEIFTCTLEWAPHPQDRMGEYPFRKLELKKELLESDFFPYFSPRLRLYLLRILKTYFDEEPPSLEKHSLLHSYKALLQFSIGKIERAQESINSLIEEKETYTALLTRGKINYELGNLSDAFGDFIKAKNSTNQNAEALVNLGVILVKVRNLKRGIKYIKKGLKQSSGSYAAWKNRALALLKAEKWKKAKQVVSVLTEMREETPEAWLCLGIAYIGLKKPKKAMEAFATYKEKTEKSEEWISILSGLAKNLEG